MNLKQNVKKILIYNFFFLTFLIFDVNSKTDFFIEAKDLYEKKQYEDSKFLFQRNIVYNPKHAKSYLYLAKIFENEDNEQEQVKNLNTTLLLEPRNEEAMYMMINIELERSNFSKVKELTKDFKQICSSLCEKTNLIDEKLKNIEAEN